MDKLLEKQLQYYVPPEIIKKQITNDIKFEIATFIIDREFKRKPQKWRTNAFTSYEDFFQSAFTGFNPYKEKTDKDKGVLQAIETYNPYKKLDKNTLLEEIGGIEQACCPFCKQRGEQVSLWSVSAGNETLPKDQAPDPVFFEGNKYCGHKVNPNTPPELISRWLQEGLIRETYRGEHTCNYCNRLGSLRNHISKQLSYLIQDIRGQEYHSKRSLKKHPHYPCPKCHNLIPDYSRRYNSPETLTCSCGEVIEVKKATEKVWKSRGINTTYLLHEHYGSEDSRGTLEEAICAYDIKGHYNAEIHFNAIEETIFKLTEQLISRIRRLAAHAVTKKQYKRLMADPNVIKDQDGVPETTLFQIFYNYFFTDNLEDKVKLNGKAKNKGDESSTYRQLALRFLKKEQHYSRCNKCKHKMYESTESGIFKKTGTRKTCELCESTNVSYHGPKCGKVGSNNPNCKEHGDIEIVMYIFQTVEPKIRKLEKIVKEDQICKDLYEELKDVYLQKEKMDNYQDYIKLLNY